MGTTIAINTILDRNGARAILLTTQMRGRRISFGLIAEVLSPDRRMASARELAEG